MKRRQFIASTVTAAGAISPLAPLVAAQAGRKRTLGNDKKASLDSAIPCL